LIVVLFFFVAFVPLQKLAAGQAGTLGEATKR
jgi:hypothetical protein